MLNAAPAGRVHRDCPACGTSAGGAAPVRYAHPDWPMVKCARCALIYLEWVPEYGALYNELAWTKQREREEQRRLRKQPLLARLDLATRWRLGLLGEATPAGGLTAWARPGAVLDVGCSTGKAFAKLADSYVPYGVEIEANAASAARAIFEPRGGKVVNADGVSGMVQFPAAMFSGISLWSYLEHEARPREALEAARKALRPDGILLVKVPNFNCWNRVVLGADWPGFRHPDHVQYFTPATLAFLAEATGFHSRFRLYGRIPVNDNMYAILTPR
jgi:SAM-dependent methyltransferase